MSRKIKSKTNISDRAEKPFLSMMVSSVAFRASLRAGAVSAAAGIGAALSAGRNATGAYDLKKSSVWITDFLRDSWVWILIVSVLIIIVSVLVAIIRSKHKKREAEITVDASLEQIPAVTAFVNAHLEKMDCPEKARKQIDVVIDELLSNIANYSYGSGTGKATVRFEAEDGGKTATITFIDSGKKYDPLSKEDPDVSLSANEREVGGLGIFMVKKMTDGINYEYRDGKNVLTVKKRLRQ